MHCFYFHFVNGFCCNKVASPAWPLHPLSLLFCPLLPLPTDLAAVMPCPPLRLGTAWWGCREEVGEFCTELTPSNPRVVSVELVRRWLPKIRRRCSKCKLDRIDAKWSSCNKWPMVRESLRRLGGQQINHQIYRKFLEMICLPLNY